MDLERLTGRRPIAYRAGAYRAGDAVIDALVQAGYRFDSSYDHLHKGNHSLGAGVSVGNDPFFYRGLVELPITCFRNATKLRRLVPPFRPTPEGLDRLGLEALRDEGARVVNYIFHSYDLMEMERDESVKLRRWHGRDARLVAWFEETLDWIADQPSDYQVIGFDDLDRLIRADPTLLSKTAIPMVAA